MVFHCQCFEFVREVEDGQNSPTKSSSSRTKKSSTKNKSSSAESYYSAHADFRARPFQNPFVLEVFTNLELKQATGNFSLHSKLEEGEYGSVYKAVVGYPRNKHEVVVKHLHKRYLQVFFGNFKSSNVLLDDQWHAKLSDFALGRLCPSQGVHNISSMAIENVEYMAPEYRFTGIAISKSDVWSYGVFLYELITGRLPFDRSLPKDEQKLLEWVNPYLNSRKFGRIVDPRLQGHYSLQSVKRLSNIANCCLAKDPKSRPRMTDVLNMITPLVKETSKPFVPIREATAPQRACEENKSSEVTEGSSIEYVETVGASLEYFRLNTDLKKDI